MAEIEKDENGKLQAKVETDIIKCPSCGSNMVFDPDSQMLYCEHCGRKESFASDLTANEIDIQKGFEEGDKWNEKDATVFRCDNCGAKVVLNKGETAKTCPFCGTAHVEKSDELPGLKPNGVLPFAFGIDKALEFTKTWVKKRIFAPKKFKKNINTENVHGVYTPCFTFDTKTTSSYWGRIGRRHTRVVGSGDNRHTETYIVWQYVKGTYYENFDDVLITAGSKFDQHKLDRTAPYDTNGSKEYQKNYLLGYMAYHYDRDLKCCWGDAKNRIDEKIKAHILRKYSYDVIDYFNVSTMHEMVTYKYVLLPVYVGNFNYRKKLFNFFVNGTNGKVFGKTPLSPWRILFAVFLGIAIVGAVILTVCLTGK